MFLWVGASKNTRRVKGGDKRRAQCGECRAETTFVEVEIVEKIQLFSVIDVLEDTERAYRCIECDGVFKLVSKKQTAAGGLEDLSPEARKQARQQAREQARQPSAAERRAALEEARRERERQAAERERRAAEREARLDDDLLALKRKMGLAEPPPEPSFEAPASPADDEPKTPTGRRRWRPWRR